MVTIASFRQLALSFPGTEEKPHFERKAFRIKKGIFVTLLEEKQQACVKLSLIEQSVFCAFDKDIIYPVNNKWGQQGWTVIELKKVKKGMLKDALTVAYTEMSNKK